MGFLIVEVKESIGIIIFNQPEKLNALTEEAYDEWLEAMTSLRNNDQVRVVLITANGKYYSAGHAIQGPPDGIDDLEEHIKFRVGITGKLVQEFITFPKIIIIGLNGPCFGFAVTSTLLADFVYAVDTVEFTTPFMPLALCVEGCSSVTFPRALGKQKSFEMLFMGKKMTALEWHKLGIVNEILPKQGFREQLMKRAMQVVNLPPKAVKASVNLCRQVDQKMLLEANEREMKVLKERLFCDEFFDAMQKFTSRKAKL